MRRLLVIGVVVVLAVAGGVWAGVGLVRPDPDDPVLDALLKDPMAARRQAAGSLTVASDVRSSGGGLFSHKPRQAEVVRAFTPAAASMATLYQQVRLQADAHGWRMQPDGPGLRGYKHLDFGRATLFISVNRYTEPATVSIVLQPA